MEHTFGVIIFHWETGFFESIYLFMRVLFASWMLPEIPNFNNGEKIVPRLHLRFCSFLIESVNAFLLLFQSSQPGLSCQSFLTTIETFCGIFFFLIFWTLFSFSTFKGIAEHFFLLCFNLYLYIMSLFIRITLSGISDIPINKIHFSF